MKKTIISFLVLGFFTPVVWGDSPRWANESVVSMEINQSLSGQEQRLGIKKELGLHAGDFIKSVIVLASSQRGNGIIELYEGDTRLDGVKVDTTLTAVQFKVNAEAEKGLPLYILSRGNIYVQSLHAVVEGQSESDRIRKEQEEQRRIAEEARQRELERQREAERIERERKAALQCVGNNTFGFYASGGGCNTFGCYWPGGGCNTFGCYYEGGSCNTFGCIKSAPKTKRACY